MTLEPSIPDWHQQETHVIQFKNEFQIWMTDTLELNENAALKRASHLLEFDFDEVRIIFPNGDIVKDKDLDNE